MFNKPAIVQITDGQSIEIERPGVHRDGAWIKNHNRDIEWITRSSLKRLRRVLSSVQWDAEEGYGDAYESGLGWDRNEEVYFYWPPKSNGSGDYHLGNWVAYIGGLIITIDCPDCDGKGCERCRDAGVIEVEAETAGE